MFCTKADNIEHRAGRGILYETMQAHLVQDIRVGGFRMHVGSIGIRYANSLAQQRRLGEQGQEAAEQVPACTAQGKRRIVHKPFPAPENIRARVKDLHSVTVVPECAQHYGILRQKLIEKGIPREQRAGTADSP